LEREDCTPMAWYLSPYAPRTGGAYDSHHRTAGIACRARRRGRVAARGARAAADDTCGWISQWLIRLGICICGRCFSPGLEGNRLCRRPERGYRIPLG